MITASYFDGQQGCATQVTLEIIGDRLFLAGHELVRSVRAASVQLAEPFRDAPVILTLEGGGRCEISGAEDKAALLSALAFKPSFVQRWQARWPAALVALPLLVGLLFSAYEWGIPALAERGAVLIPLEVERRLGDVVLVQLDGGILEPSGLAPEKREQLREAFARMAPAHPRMPLTLEFRKMGTSPNALALPNGTVIITDKMVEASSEDGERLSQREIDMLAGVLAHEIGHVELRHSLKSVVSTTALGAIFGTLFGDFSTVAASAPAIITQLEYSRAKESEADEYAIRALIAQGLSPDLLADQFEALSKAEVIVTIGKKALPSWARRTTGYLSTHPATEARIARFRQAAALQANGFEQPHIRN